MKLFYEVKDNYYQNVKNILKNYFQMSDRLIAKLKHENKIFLNQKKVYVTNLVKIGDILEIDLCFNESSTHITPTQMNLDILHEDESLLIINKPPFMPVHPSSNHYTHTLANGVQYYYFEKNILTKIRPVNRLDKDTSGIVIFAKNQYVQEALINQMKTNHFVKEYIAILDGKIENTENFTVCAPIARKPNSIIEREVNSIGDTAITHFKVLNTFENYTAVKCILETGRTHQIRVHSQYIGHPILGDSLYGALSQFINRQALHSSNVKFIHPISKKIISIECPLPLDMHSLMNINIKEQKWTS